MVKIDINKPNVGILYSGDPISVATEMAAAVSSIYQGMSSKDAQSAIMFRKCMGNFMQEDSPVWTHDHQMTMVSIPIIKEENYGNS